MQKLLYFGIITVILLLLYWIYVQIFRSSEGFVSIPNMTIPVSSTTNGKDAEEHNICWRSLLQYLEKHPENAHILLNDMKQKFFQPSCEFKQPSIDFAKVAEEYRPIFS